MSKPKRGTPRRRKAKPRKRAPAPRRSTAIAVIPKPDRALPQALTPTPMLGELGLVELKLTAEEEAVLSEPVDPSRVMIKPTKAPTPYLSHPEYTRWFNRAFGRLGWALVPCSTASKVDNSIQCSYLLYVHGKPVAFAVGEQEYYADNREQTFGDALESTNASALRRLAKRMGVGLELWDRDWLDGWIARHAVRVKILQKFKEDGVWKEREAWAWRRKGDAPLYNEVDKPPRPAGSSKAAHNPKDDQPITDEQRKRFWTIVKRRGRLHAEIEVWLAAQYQVTDSKKITRRDYDAICTAVERPGPLPMPVEREPGSDDQ